MAGNTPSPAYWIALISKRELPALTSTAKILDKFSNDDVSSLAKLSETILHDQALSSCLLKVANSVQRYSATPVTTVSRATVVLGIQTVKNICLTSKVIESLLKNKNLSLAIYNKIKGLMAHSFYAGQLAKMMLPNYNEDTQEEVYLATMLRRIGETAFWCLGEDFKDELESLVQVQPLEYEKKCRELIGMNFDELSAGLAKNWNLGELLVKSLDSPETRTKEMQVIYLADKLVQYINQPPSAKAFDELIGKISSLMNISERQLIHRIAQTKDKSIELLSSYGAQMLIDFVKDLPKASELSDTESLVIAEITNKDAAQLQAIQHLTMMTATSRDINQFVEYTLSQIARILAFDITGFYLLSGLKQSVNCRLAVNRVGNPIDYSLSIPLSESNNILQQVLNTQSGVRINSAMEHQEAKFPFPTNKLFADYKVALAPVQIKHKNIGVVIAQRNSDDDITADDLNKFQFFIQHLNMCLTLISPAK